VHTPVTKSNTSIRLRFPARLAYANLRIWRAHGLKPHLVETFKVSRDKNFAAKVADVVGLYLNPPDKGAGALRRRKEIPRGWVATDALAG
jgi:hypothetical protein